MHLILGSSSLRLIARVRSMTAAQVGLWGMRSPHRPLGIHWVAARYLASGPPSARILDRSIGATLPYSLGRTSYFAVNKNVASKRLTITAVVYLRRRRRPTTRWIATGKGSPRTDGIEFIRGIRQHSDTRIRHIAAAALTAYARSEDRTIALQSGFQLHRSKPIEPQALSAFGPINIPASVAVVEWTSLPLSASPG
jgi:CheY-like chemotaxis protein